MFNYLKEKNLKKAYSKSIFLSFKKNYLVPIGNWILKNNKIIKSINKYRSIHNKCFINEIDSNLNKTKNYFKKLLMIKRCVYLLSRQIQKIFYGVIGLKEFIIILKCILF